MATIRLFSSFSFLTAQDWDWQVTQNTATSLTIEDLAAGKKQVFTGSFTYTGAQVNGTCTGTTFFEDGAMVYRVIGMNHDAATLQAFAAASGDTQETYAFVLSGNDVVVGSDLSDTLLSYGGNDRLDGGTGADGMLGGAGNDIYIVDHARDRVFETTTRSSGIDAGGIDTVKASASFRLSDFVEKLTLTGSGNIDGTGNALGNTMVGNSGANALAGGGGNDAINGAGGDDVLVGGSGKDTMTGGAGADTFDFNAVTDSGATRTTWDVVKDFVGSLDTIDLQNIDADSGTAGDQAFTFTGLGDASSWGGNGLGKLRYEVLAAGVVVYGSTDMDVEAEFSIFLTGVDSILGSDFVL